MDPVTGAIVAALTAGVLSGATEVGKKAVVSTYEALKQAIQKKSSAGEDVVESIKSLEQKPESKARQAVVAEEVEEADLSQDPDLVKLAQQLLEALKETEAGQKAMSKYNLRIENSEVGNIGDHAHIEGGIHFGGK